MTDKDLQADWKVIDELRPKLTAGWYKPQLGIKNSFLVVPSVDNKPAQIFLFKQPFGGGQYGVIFLAHEENGNKCVLKAQNQIDNQLLNEVKALDALGNLKAKLQTVPEAKGASIIPKDKNSPSPQSIDMHWIAMPLIAGKDLKAVTDSANHAATKPSSATSTQALDVMLASALALKEVHDKGVVHNDINPCNIMYDAVTKQAKLVDFGTSLMGKEHKAAPCGAPPFIEPAISAELIKIREADQLLEKAEKQSTPLAAKTFEKLANQKLASVAQVRLDDKSDIYALAKTLAVVTGLAKQPDLKAGFFESVKIIGPAEKVVGKMMASNSPAKQAVIQLLEDMTHKDVEKRPSLDQIINRLKVMKNNLINDMYKTLQPSERVQLHVVSVIEALNLLIIKSTKSRPSSAGLFKSVEDPLITQLKKARELLGNHLRTYDLSSQSESDFEKFSMEIAIDIRNIKDQMSARPMQNKVEKNIELQNVLIATTHPDKGVKKLLEVMNGDISQLAGKVDDALSSIPPTQDQVSRLARPASSASVRRI
jgi:serine/threonine protein kinase